MKRQIAYLLGSAAALMAVNAVQAAPTTPSPTTAVQSYADLLEPVPAPMQALAMDDLAQSQQAKPLLQLAQYYHHHHHHHHHHHRYFGGFGVTIGPGVYAGPDCYIRRRVFVNRWGEEVVRRVRVCD